MFCAATAPVQRSTPHVRLRENSRYQPHRLRAAEQPPAVAADSAGPADSRFGTSAALPPCVVHEDDDLLVVNKPAGAALSECSFASPNCLRRQGLTVGCTFLCTVARVAGWTTHAPSPYASEGVYDW